MNYIALVKQVPDTKHIPRDAWDWDTGTLRRALLDNVCNDLDQQAMAFALELRREIPGQIVALTMGPPFAEEVLRHALSLGVDHGVLLTDRRLGGADTPATAYPLAQAIRKIEREIFKGDHEYLIVTGMQSVDGDTAQVPPQVAEELGIAQVAYVTDHNIGGDGMLTVQRVTRKGTEKVAIERFPCLVTLTQWTLPPYPEFHQTRRAYSREIHQWDAEAVKTDPSRIGLAGSRTNVVKIFPAKEATQRRCLMVTEVKELVRQLKATYGSREEKRPEHDKSRPYKVPLGKKTDYRGDLWIYAEHGDGKLHPASFELLGKARELAVPLGEKVGAVLVGGDVVPLATELIAHGADKVFVVEHPSLKDFIASVHSLAVTQLVDARSPQIFLFSATPLGRELAPRVAYAVGSGLTADSTDLQLGDLKRGKLERVGILMQTRPALGGNIMATIVSQHSRVQMSTARPGVLQAFPPDPARTGEVIHFHPKLPSPDPGVRILSVETVPETSGLGGADIVVAGGIGCRTKENFDRQVGSLADGLGRFFNTEAMVGASRQAVEAGFIDRGRQIGQTGQTIAPKLYVALGISGAVQHVTGVREAGIVVAINKNPDAPIFRDCDFGMAGNVETVVPELVDWLNQKEAGGNG